MFDDKASTLDLTGDLDRLNNIQLPATLDEGLTKLNNSMPTFQDVQNFTDNAIRLPFEEVKPVLNGSLRFSSNRSLLPVPQKEALTFCSDDNCIGDFFNDLTDIANLVRRIFIAVLINFCSFGLYSYGVPGSPRMEYHKESFRACS